MSTGSHSTVSMSYIRRPGAGDTGEGDTGDAVVVVVGALVGALVVTGDAVVVVGALVGALVVTVLTEASPSETTLDASTSNNVATAARISVDLSLISAAVRPVTVMLAVTFFEAKVF